MDTLIIREQIKSIFLVHGRILYYMTLREGQIYLQSFVLQ